MKLQWIILIIVSCSLIGIIRILYKAWKDQYIEPIQGTIIIQPNLEVYEIDEFSPENLRFDQALRTALLKKRLKGIEERKTSSAPFQPMSIFDYLSLRKSKGQKL